MALTTLPTFTKVKVWRESRCLDLWGDIKIKWDFKWMHKEKERFRRFKSCHFQLFSSGSAPISLLTQGPGLQCKWGHYLRRLIDCDKRPKKPAFLRHVLFVCLLFLLQKLLMKLPTWKVHENCISDPKMLKGTQFCLFSSEAGNDGPFWMRIYIQQDCNSSQKFSQQWNANEFQGKDLCSFFHSLHGETMCDRAHTLNI